MELLRARAAFSLSSQLASSSVVPKVPWDARGGLIVTCGVHLPPILSVTAPMCLVKFILQRAVIAMATIVSLSTPCGWCSKQGECIMRGAV